MNRLSENADNAGKKRQYKILYMELEHIAQQMEGYLRMILNDPDFYTESVWKFFNKH